MPPSITDGRDPAPTIEALQQQLEQYQSRMLTKQEVAHRTGMTVSWLNNSQSELASNIRASGVRYGKSRTAPIRFPLAQLIRLLDAQRESKTNQP